MKKIIYIRVSKEEEGAQDPTQQRDAIIQKFDLKAPTVFQDRGSAYDLSKMGRRRAFLQLIACLFGANTTSVADLFQNKFLSTEVELYVWDYARIIRNIELNLLFSILCDLFNVKIISYKEGIISKDVDEKPSEKFARYMMSSIHAFSSEDYSYHISQNIKKAVNVERGVTVSSKGNKWGGQYTSIDGKKATLDTVNIIALNRRIRDLIKYHSYQYGSPKYELIQKKIGKEYNLRISKAYISKLRN